MSNTKNAMKGFMPMFPGMNAMPPMPPMPFMPPMPEQSFWGGKKSDKDVFKDQWNDFKANLESYWNQLRDMQDSSTDAAKEQWGKFFGQIMEMQEIFATSLPDEIPSLPWLPDFFKPSMSPRAFMKKVKEFQEMANAHAVEQADSFLDFCKKGQEQAKDMVSEAVKNVEDKVEQVEETVQEAVKPEEVAVKPEEEAVKPEKKADKPEKKADKPAKKADKPEKKADKPEKKAGKTAKKADKPAKKADEPEKAAGEAPEGTVNNEG